MTVLTSRPSAVGSGGSGHGCVVAVPRPRQPVGDAPQTLLVAGGRRELEDVLRDADAAGWQPWAVARTAGPGWRLRLGRTD